MSPNSGGLMKVVLSPHWQKCCIRCRQAKWLSWPQTPLSQCLWEGPLVLAISVCVQSVTHVYIYILHCTAVCLVQKLSAVWICAACGRFWGHVVQACVTADLRHLPWTAERGTVDLWSLSWICFSARFPLRSKYSESEGPRMRQLGTVSSTSVFGSGAKWRQMGLFL